MPLNKNKNLNYREKYTVIMLARRKYHIKSSTFSYHIDIEIKIEVCITMYFYEHFKLTQH